MIKLSKHTDLDPQLAKIFDEIGHKSINRTIQPLFVDDISQRVGIGTTTFVSNDKMQINGNLRIVDGRITVSHISILEMLATRNADISGALSTGILGVTELAKINNLELYGLVRTSNGAGVSGQVLTSNGGSLGTSWNTPTVYAATTEAYVTIGNTAGLSAERALTGTTNQVVVTDNGANSTVVLSTPQDIHTAASPTFSDLTLSGHTASRIVVTGTGGAIDDAAALTNGQLLIGSTSAAPVAATITGTVNQITVSNGAGTITLATPQNIHTAATPTFGATTVNGALAVDGDLNFTGTQAITTTSGALGLTPASGSNLNVTLATTGDLAVNTDDFYVDTSADRVGIGTTTPLSRLEVVRGSANTVADTMQDFSVVAASSANPSNGQLSVQANDAMGVDLGGTLTFGARYITADSGVAAFAAIRGAKENGTSGNLSGYMSFHPRANGVSYNFSNSEKMRLTSAGRLGIGTASPGVLLDVRGAVAAGTNGTEFTVSAAGVITGANVAITGAAASPPVANVIYKDNIVKAWINFNGTGTIAIRDSFNISSIGDDGTGSYTINWNTDFADANYSLAGVAWNQAGTGPMIVCMDSGSTQVAGQVTFLRVKSVGEVNTDVAQVTVIAIGDQ